MGTSFSRPPVERILLTFRQSNYSALRDLSAADLQGTVVLTGVVPSIQIQHLAQSVAQRVEGVRRVDNRTVVKS